MSKSKTIPSLAQMRADNAEAAEWVTDEVGRYRAHRANRPNWNEHACTCCGHLECIRFEEESCNYDGCPKCNTGIGAEYCSRGSHEWSYRSPYSDIPADCIICGAWDLRDEDEDDEVWWN
jgi:hypothetical protein